MDKKIFTSCLVTGFIFSAAASLLSAFILPNVMYVDANYTLKYLSYLIALSLLAIANFTFHLFWFEKRIGIKKYQSSREELIDHANNVTFSNATAHKPFLFLCIMLFLLPYSVIFTASPHSTVQFKVFLGIYPIYYGIASYACFQTLLFFLIKYFKKYRRL